MAVELATNISKVDVETTETNVAAGVELEKTIDPGESSNIAGVDQAEQSLARLQPSSDNSASSSPSREINGLARKVRFIDGLILPRADTRGLILDNRPVTLLRRHEAQEESSQQEGPDGQGTSESAIGSLIAAIKQGSSKATGSSPGKRQKANKQSQTPSTGGITPADP